MKYIKIVGHPDSRRYVTYEIRMKCLICGEMQTAMCEVCELEGMSDGLALRLEKEFCEQYGRHALTEHYN